jgi:uncharacterized membrane-anchored protein
MSRRSGLVLGLALILLVVNALVFQKEVLLREGTRLFLELAPVDPRSLIQGDYMRLDYALTRDLQPLTLDWPRDGRLVVVADERGVAGFVRRDQGQPLEGNERFLRYRIRGGRLGLGAESFFFQEGHAELYEQARFAEIRATPKGDLVLVGLRDEALQPLVNQAAPEPGPRQGGERSNG